MTGRLDKVSERSAVAADVRAGCRLEKTSIFPTTRSSAARRLAIKAGLVIGYLGLVVTLSMAPFWHQVTPSSMAEPTQYTDFGGSR